MSFVRSLEKHKALALLALVTCTSVIFFDSTLIPVSVPTIKREFGLTENLQQWIVNSYFLILSSFVFAGGKLADRFGCRRLFCLGMALFELASIFGGMAYSGFFLILCRGFQGLGAALMISASMALLTQVFPEGERGKAVGLLVSVSSIFLILGSFVGGILCEFLTWRYIFWGHLPIAIFGIFLVLYAIPKSKTRFTSFNIPSFLSLSLGIGCLVFSLMQAKGESDSSCLCVLLFFLFSLLFFFCFFLSLRFSPSPFMDFSLFKNKTFLWGNILIFITQFLTAITVFWPICFQNMLHYTPFHSGLLMLPSTIPVLIFAPISGHLSDKFGPKIPTQIGFSCIALSLLWLCFAKLSLPIVYYLFPALLMFGCGISLVLTPIGSVTLSCFSLIRKGEASGIYNMMRFSGATFGVATIGTVMTNIGYYRFNYLMRKNHLSYPINSKKIWSSLDALKNAPCENFEGLKELISNSLHFAFSLGNAFVAIFGCIGLIIASLYFRKATEWQRNKIF